jgi:RNA polymerase sigma-70 factor, ECF subfamily
LDVTQRPLAGLYKTVEESGSGTEREKQFTELFNLHYPKVLAYARRRLRPEVSDDAVADAFLSAWINLDRKPDDALLWLYGLARGAVSHHRRRIERIEHLGLRSASLLPTPSSPDHAESAGWQEPFNAAFAHLTESEREVLRITAWEGLDASEGAVVLSCSVSAFKVRLHRARRHLRQLLLAAEDSEREAKPDSSKDAKRVGSAYRAHSAVQRPEWSPLTETPPRTAREIS